MTMTTAIATMDGEEDFGGPRPATLEPAVIAELFRRVDLALYGDARRDFLRLAGLGNGIAGLGGLGSFGRLGGTSPITSSSIGSNKEIGARIERYFEEWFAFDCELNRRGETPFGIASQYLHGVLECIDLDEYRELQEVTSTNRASWFRIVDANAVSGRLWLEDQAGGDVYAVHDRSLAARFDGMRRGTFVGRIAASRGVWRLIGEPLRLSRREDDDRAHARFCQLLDARRPTYVDLVRLLYGRESNTNADWNEERDYTRNHGVETLWSRLTNFLL